MKVTADGLSDAVMDLLDAYSADVKDDLTAVVKTVSKDCLADIKRKSPRRTGGYAKSWSRKLSKSNEQPSATIYNKKYYMLTHLLEDGHAKADGGRVEGVPHIAPAAEQAAKDLEKGIIDILEEK